MKEAKSPLTVRMVDMTIQEWIELFYEANTLLGSAYQIAQRKGKDTNWTAFTKRLKRELNRQHKLLYPKTNL
jgi:hypothetical protein